MKRWNFLVAGFLIMVACALLTHPAPANGSKGKRMVLEGKISLGGNEDYSFTAEFEPILFRILTFQKKYRVIRININNKSQQPLQLSLQKDAVQFRADGRTVTGILDIAGRDPSLWNPLPPELRNALAYPDQAPIKAHEEENVFVFVPEADLWAFPQEIQFKIDSCPKSPVLLRNRLAMKK